MDISRYIWATKPEGSNRYLVYSFLSGVMLWLTERQYQNLLHVDELSEESSFARTLHSYGFAIADEDEIEYLRERYIAGCTDSDDLYITICPTLDCNFACPYCFEDARKGVMDDETIAAVLRFVEARLDAYAYKSLHIFWLGGEPLLCIDIIERMTAQFQRMCEERGLRYSAKMASNGYYFDQDMAKRLEACDVEQIMITLDGIGARHDATRFTTENEPTFERILANLQNTKTDILILLRSNLHAGNTQDIPALYELRDSLRDRTGNDIDMLLSRVNCGNAVFQKEFDLELLDGPAHADAIFACKPDRALGRDIIPKFSCGSSSKHQFAIDERGNLYNCTDSLGNDACVFGTVFDRDVLSGGATNKTELSFYFEHGFPEDEECLNCFCLPRCMGGCPASRVRFQVKACDIVRYRPDDFVVGRFKAFVRQATGDRGFDRLEKIIKEHDLPYWNTLRFMQKKADNERSNAILYLNTDALWVGNSNYIESQDYIQQHIQAMDLEAARAALNDKTVLFSRMPHLMGRRFLDLRTATDEDLARFVRTCGRAVTKSNVAFGLGLRVLTPDDIPPVAELLDEECAIAEEWIYQHSLLDAAYSGQIASFRVMTFSTGKKTELAARPVLRIESDMSVRKKDNVSGRDFLLFDYDGSLLVAMHGHNGTLFNPCSEHAETGFSYEGFTLPFFEEALAMCIQAHAAVPEDPFVNWDVAITEKGPLIIEGNGVSGFTSTYQVLEYHVGHKDFKREILARFQTLQG